MEKEQNQNIEENKETLSEDNINSEDKGGNEENVEVKTPE